ncbi:hypothetical protein LTR84_009960 [Exophiala bonariae]|uniref:Large ribosomal subunit protein mL67 n=1 Tax=Exophiala bonariae TaxID=1690606 RepID=A0AAV9NNK0_9EURO|nr:hypothetical protein LTR84_009960 [Exophiala bonariae]
MATAAANSAAHHVNLASLPPLPRIRPPRLLKGDPHPNNNPRPHNQSSASNRIWVQGKWRHPTSNAAEQHREVQYRRVSKALRHRSHGLDIYAYRHVRTNQVVYSLSRSLQNTQVLKQLLFHGKKTVPEAVRRDMWTPYFSVHFPDNLAGASTGLEAFKSLRELSTQRQLSPTKALLTATEEDVEIARSKLGGPLEIYRLEQSDNWQDKRKLELKLPKAGELLPKKLRARRLMDQKATSVADVAFVLDRISSGPGPLEKMIAMEIDRVARHKEQSRRGRARLNAAARRLTAKETKMGEVAQLVLAGKHDPDSDARFSFVQIDRLGLEHQLSRSPENSRGFINDGRGESLSRATELWQSLNPINPALVDVEEYKERRAVSQAAEHEALKAWHSSEHQSSSASTASMWTFVKEKRQAALDSFDESYLERKKSAALARAAAEAATEHEELQTAGTGTSPASLEDLVSSKQAAALENFEKREVERRENLNRAIKEATSKLLSGTLARQGGVEQSSTKADSELSPAESPWSNTWDIKMYWADLNDGTFAKSWPQTVIHDLLEPYAVTKGSNGLVSNKSVHVIGRGLHDGWVPQEQLTDPQRPAPKSKWEAPEVEVEEESAGMGRGHRPIQLGLDRSPVEQPPPAVTGIFARLRQSILGR